MANINLKKQQMRKEENTPNSKPYKLGLLGYVALIDDMNEETFEKCVNLLYPVLDFRVLKENDIRKIDLEEKLLEFAAECEKTFNNCDTDLVSYYLSFFRYFFEKSFHFGIGSRAEKFQKRALELIGEAISEKGTSYDIEDVMIIFISVARKIFEDDADDVKCEIADIDIGVTSEDFELLRKISVHEEFRPLGYKKKVEKEGKINAKNQASDFQVKVFYVNNIIFLCKALQTRGLI